MVRPLRAVVRSYIGGGWGKEARDSSHVEEAYVIRGTDIEDITRGRIDDVPLRYHKQSNARSRLLEAGDLVFEVSGGSKDQPVGRSILVTDERLHNFTAPAIPASFCKRISPDRGLVDPRFLHAHLQLAWFDRRIVQWQVQSTGLSNFKFEEFLDQFEIDLPPLVVQRRIADILFAYDRLIDNSQRRIYMLEQVARSLYREWFVHFRLPWEHNGATIGTGLSKVPKGWEAIPFERLLVSMTGGDWGSEEPDSRESAAVAVVRGTDFDEVAYGWDLRVPVRYIKPSSLTSRGLRVGDVIVENSINAKSRCVGTPLIVDGQVMARLGRDAIAASFCKVFRFHDPKLAPLAYLHLRHLREAGRMEYYQNVAANGIGNFQAQKFAKEEHLVVPANRGVDAQLVEKLGVLIKTVSLLASQIKILRRTRNLLLPRLLARRSPIRDNTAA